VKKQQLTVKNQDEFTQLVNNSDFRIVRAIVEGALQNLNTTRRFIHILTVEVEDEDDIYELTLDRKEILGCLKRNLVHYEDHEWYEKCREIVNAIEYLENKEKQQDEKNNNSGRKEEKA
jgi:hypothetical protein